MRTPRVSVSRRGTRGRPATLQIVNPTATHGGSTPLDHGKIGWPLVRAYRGLGQPVDQQRHAVKNAVEAEVERLVLAVRVGKRGGQGGELVLAAGQQG